MNKSLTTLLTVCLVFLIASTTNNLMANPSIPPNWQPIYIKNDGSISPANSPIKNLGENQYIVSDDLSATGSTYTFHNIVVEKDNIVLDGANHFIDGLGLAWGIDINSRNNITIKNILISKFSGGILIYNSSEVIILNCSILSNAEGIRITNSTVIQIINNNLNENYHMAVSIGKSNNTLVYGNDLSYNGRTDIFSREGIYLSHSSNNYFIANNIIRHSAGIHTFNSSNNYFYLNNIIDNQIQVKEELNERDWWTGRNESIGSEKFFLYFSVNKWDNGSVGNYWSPYKGIDSNKDGIGDVALLVNDKNTDNYPLIKENSNYANLVNIDSLNQLIYQNSFPTTKGVPDENYVQNYLVIFSIVVLVIAIIVAIPIILERSKRISK